MTLVVETPATRPRERDYIFNVVLKEFLGLSWSRVSGKDSRVRMYIPGHAGEIRMPDIFLQTPDQGWLTSSSLPREPLTVFDIGMLGLSINLVDLRLPIIYGDQVSEARLKNLDSRVHGHQTFSAENAFDYLCLPGQEKVGNRSTNQETGVQSFTSSFSPYPLYLPIDIFGSAFFMLTRYEEIVRQDRDEHDRFPGRASLAYRGGFLDRPIIDEYLEVLRAAMKKLWPGLESSRGEGRIWVSCDVDNPYAIQVKSWFLTARRAVADLVKRRDPSTALSTLRNTYFSRRGCYNHDPFHTFDWMMDVNEEAGNRMSFYFMSCCSDSVFCAPYQIQEKRILELLRCIHARGHEIGLHGSYGSFRNAALISRERRNLASACRMAGADDSVRGNRQHYLRWDAARTQDNLEEASFEYDTSGSFADLPGFRYGTCRDFPMWSWKKQRGLKIRQCPLVLMECSVIADRYLGLGYSIRALEHMLKLKSRALRFGGSFTLLWHNSHFRNLYDREFYISLISRRL